ncbi:nucleoside-diphosphate sugar epimerase/dehydratase [Mesorhizobium sp. RMAD-H1]|uniref:polysaccharide biosynthesis protein n=1 Tax=Mesorhizobium sp. RMAD-H1 TaxID=2587065 RepID=UPI0016160344|nr:nucleoside-diphosphate sugar epimerase/dehydratase [Mesorhizobium sp. RMAD-H1]MBB2970077.1 FlaA1/EpsC-like NDP-sugar epimerase [Mesorhizobium sp. RMAD-H1]
MNLNRICGKLSLLPRFSKQLILASADFVLLLVSVYLAYVLRLGFVFTPNWAQCLLMLAAPVLAIPVFLRFGLYRAIIRYLPERAIWPIFQATAIASLFWVMLVFLTEMTGGEGVPRSVPLLYWLLSTILIASSRFGAKWLLRLGQSGKTYSHSALIVGAGEAGRQLATALRSHSDTFVLGFVDKDPALYGMDIVGLRVYPPEQVQNLIENHGITEVVVCDPTLDGAQRRQLIAQLSKLPVDTRILPPIADLTRGKYLVSALRSIEIDDLLGRSPVPPDASLLRSMVEGKTIMVTGAGGSIGSQLCRTVAYWSPARIILFEMSEFALYQIDRTLREAANCEIVPVLGSVLDQELVERAIRQYGVDTVYHCAAYKHVPLVEANPFEGIRNNVFGTAAVAQAVLATQTERMVLISSDKAVRPTNVMGATKRWAEFIVQYYSSIARSAGRNQSFSSVRFGNVLGSNGSVVPLFQEQIARGGPVTLTHEDMTRYFMSIREASELIIQSGAVSETGDTVLLEMGEPVKIRDLAENMILLAGLTVRNAQNPDGDIAIEVIGIREGEKLYEELFYDPSSAEVTKHPKIMRARHGGLTVPDLPAELERLRAAVSARDEERARRILFGLIEAASEPRKLSA